MAFKVAELFADLKINATKFNQGLKDANGKLANTNKGAKKLIPSFGKAKIAMLAFSASAGLALKKVISEVAQFDTQFQQTLNLLSDADQAQFGAGLRSGVKALSVEFGRSLGDVTNGLFDLISAGSKSEDALSALRAGLKLSVASSISAGSAIDALTTIQNSFNLSAKDFSKTSDLLFQINKAGKTTVEKLSQSIGNLASVASSTGVSVEEMGASVSTLTFNGIKTAETMTKLKALFNELGKIEFAKKVREQGIAFADTDLKTLGLVGTLSKLSALTGDQVKLITQNQEAQQALNILLNSSTKFQADYNGQLNRGGATNKAYEASSKTLGETLNKLKSIFNQVFLEVGENLLGSFKKVSVSLGEIGKIAIGSISPILSLLKNIGSALLTLTQIIASAGVALGVVGVAMGVAFGPVALVSLLALAPAVIALTLLMRELGQVLEENIAKQKRFDQLGKEVKTLAFSKFVNPVKKFEKSLDDLFIVQEKVKSGLLKKSDTTNAFSELEKSAKKSIATLEKTKADILSGKAITLGTGLNKADAARNINKSIEEIKKQLNAKKIDVFKEIFQDKASKRKIEIELDLKKTKEAQDLFKEKLIVGFNIGKDLFDKAKKAGNVFADKIKEATQEFLDKSQRALSFKNAEKEALRIKALDALSLKDAKSIFEKGKQGEKVRFTPQELLNAISRGGEALKNKIKEGAGELKNASFTTVDALSKNLQLSFLNGQEKDGAIKTNTQKLKENTDAMKKLTDKLANGGGGFMKVLG